MIKKHLLIKYLTISLFSTTLYSETIEVSDLFGMQLKDINNKQIVTYNKKTNELKSSYYFIKNSQLFKKEDLVLFPANDLNFRNYRLLSYKKELEKIGCSNYKAKECINKFTPTSKYFYDEGEKIYILDNKKSKIYNIIKYNYNKFLE